MIDSNIIRSLGAGSGIDTKSLVSQLVEIERAAPQFRIDSKRDSTEAKISDFGLVSSALSELQNAAKLLTEPTGLFSKTASYTDSDALVPTELDTDVQAGSYAFTVEQTAKSHSLAFEGFSSPDDAVGEGEITFNFGSWEREDPSAVPPITSTTFSQSGDKVPTTITIDSTNNSLEGLRDAINDADMGVTASIVYDGSEYHLTVLSESGEQNEIQMTVEEGAGDPLLNNDSTGLSRFAFNENKAGFDSLETQAGQDAILTLNGLEVRRSSNTIDDIVQGLHMDVLKADPGQTVTITVEDDKNYAEQNIRGFVEAYNLFLDAVKPAFGVSEVEDEQGNKSSVIGSLSSDALGKSVMTQIRSLISDSVPGLSDSNLTALTNIGVRTELDGSLSISEDEFSAAFDDNYEEIQKLFAPSTSTSDSDIYINSYNGGTMPGDYDIVITQPPSKGQYNGGALDAGMSFPLDTTGSGKDYSFDVSVDGVASGALTIPEGNYNSAEDMAIAIQSAINGDQAIQDGGARANVSYNSTTNSFDITSDKYGDSSNVSITAAGADLATDLGLVVANGTAGNTVAGTINGVAGFGSGNVLLPSLGEPGAGMGMIIGENATSATVSYSRGFAGELESLVNDLLGPGGVIAAREESLNDSLEVLDTDQESLERRLGAFEERLIQQYINMEKIINSFNSSGSFIGTLIDTLPFTAKNN